MKTKSTIESPHILACDPSLTAFGWAIIDENGEIVKSGTIKTEPNTAKTKVRKGDDRCRRISEINSILLKLIKRYNVKYIVSEQPHGSQSAVAAIMIGACLGILQTLADAKGLGIEWYSEGDCKKHLLGKRSGSKLEGIDKIVELYPSYIRKNIKYRDEAEADAIAVYHYAAFFSPVIKFLKANT